MFASRARDRFVSLGRRPLPPGARPPTAAFDGARVSGFGGCNRYTGEVEEKALGAITIGALAATKMACPAPAMEIEAHMVFEHPAP